MTVHPRSGGMPVIESNKADFFDALYHSALVVGINTSALIEAAILGKRSFTVADPRYQRTQEGTLHFHYLTEGGILQKSPDFDTHLKQMADELKRGAEGRVADLRRFIESFIRPHGLDKPATPIVGRARGLDPGDQAAARRPSWLRAWRSSCLRPIALLAWIPERAGRDARFLDPRVPIRAVQYRAHQDARTRRHWWPGARHSIIRACRSRSSSPRPGKPHAHALGDERAVDRALAGARGEPGDVLYDVGANVGAFSLVAAKAHDQAVRVFAFEPSFVTYAALCRNILENGCDKSVTPMPIALTEDKGNTVFKYRSLISGATQHALGQQTLATKDFKETKARLPAAHPRHAGRLL